MTFNSDKCEVIQITHKRDLSVPMYHFFGELLKGVNQKGINSRNNRDKQF